MLPKRSELLGKPELRTETIGDVDCGMNSQAAVFLKLLSTMTVDVPPGVFITTHPYCNLRERGFVLRAHSPKGEYLHLAFFEHRNSDDLCALKWVGDQSPTGGYTADDVPTSVYPDKWSVTKQWPCREFAPAAEWVYETIESFVS